MAVLGLGLVSAPAQFAPGAGEVPGLDQAMRKLFEKVDGFTSTTVMTIGGNGQNVVLTVAMSMLNGDTRTEVDLAKMQGAPIPLEMLAQLKAAGMDRMTTLSYARGSRSLMIYPGMKAYAEITSARTAGAGNSECAVEKSVLGAEDVGGRSCEKSSVKIKCEGSPEVAMTVWTDKSRKDLPVKLAMTQDGVNLTMEFRDFKEGKPDAKLFVEPKEFKKYDSMQELMMANMQKLMQAAPGQ
jgi:hypothetical protein